jgi:SAM-dependent methyltransferase
MDRAQVFDSMKMLMRELNNGWWFAHDYFKSRARFVHASAYDTPADIGDFDAIVFAAVLLHLRDPLRALENAANRTREWIIITDIVSPAMTPAELKRPLAFFLPNPGNIAIHGGLTWWHFSPEFFVRYLDAKGFEIESLTTGDYRHISRPRGCFTIVARRASVSHGARITSGSAPIALSSATAVGSSA